MKEITVTFKDVGAQRKSWTANVRDLSYRELLKAVKAQDAVLSKSVEFSLDDVTKTGAIFVGIFRQIGTFSWN